MRLHDQILRAAFWPLPDHVGQPSAARRTGIEVEFAGLTLEQTAEIICASWGGGVSARDVRALEVSGGRHGRVKVELDIALRQAWLEDIAAQALGDLVPVEIVTSPLPQRALPEVTVLLDSLTDAGAMGTQHKLGFGFGIHLNPEFPPAGVPAFLAITRAYALLEPWLRDQAPLDVARRVLPFVAPWPLAFCDALAEGPLDLSEFAALYAQLVGGRGFGLDLLPALQDLCPSALAHLRQSALKGARPTFHYRLPETRLGDPDWSLAYEWNRWALVEAVAADRALLDALGQAWRAHRTGLVSRSSLWASEVEARLQEAHLPARLHRP